jgi:hypothetical protein
MTQAAEPLVSRNAPGIPRKIVPDDEMLRSFAEHGYLVFRDVISKDGLSALRDRIFQEYDRAKSSGSLFNGGGGLSGHLNCFPGEESRWVYEAMFENGVLDVVKALMPNVVGSPNVGLNMNLPKSVAQHYHSDSAFLQGFMVVNIAVVDTTIENGAIDVLPGTHKKFYKFWRFTIERAERLTTRIQMKQGDVLIRTSNLWHRGMPNLTNVPRPMMALTWEAGGRKDDGFKIDGGKVTFHPNWFYPTVLGRLRERTFVTAPFTYSAYRFARSLVGNKGYATP